MEIINVGQRYISIKIKLLFALFVVMLPLVILMIYINFYVSNVTRNQVAQSNRNFISLYMGQIDQNLVDINNYLLNMAVQDQNLLLLERSQEKDPDSYNISKIRLFNKLTNYCVDNSLIDYFFVYSIINKDLMLAPGNFLEQDYGKRKKTQEIFQNYFLNKTESGDYQFINWQMIFVNNNPYIFQIIRTGDIYIGVLIDEKKMEVPLHKLDFGNNGQAFFISENREPIGESSFIRVAKENHVSFNYRNDSYILTGDNKQYLLVGDRSKQGNFGLVVMLLDNEVLKKSPFVQSMVILTLSGTLFVVFFSLFFIRRTILFPIDTIIRGMRRLRNGHLDTRIVPYSTAMEFVLMNESFNTMADQIQQLKINIYEERLKHQSAELKHLQLQINPHFFLNSLNIIYYLAQVKDFELIQEMSNSLIHYFRFMFQLKSDFISLQDEVKHTRNYLRIQELRFPDNLAYTLLIPVDLSCLVPPLIIQSFVENSIKYAQSLDHLLQIEIAITMDDDHAHDEPRMKIYIKDSGNGFAENVLRLLQQNKDLSHDEGDHIGIWNMKRRLDLLYQGKASITFSNALKPDKGAVVEIRIPYLQGN